MRRLIKTTIAFLCLNLPAAYAGDIVGQWQTIDDETGKAKSIVEIIKKNNGHYEAKVLQLLLKPNDTVCDKCEGDLHNKPIVGMTILSGMKKDGEEYSGGEILDPAKGKVYRCKMWLEDGKLKVRGYLAFLYRTQTWHRADGK